MRTPLCLALLFLTLNVSWGWTQGEEALPTEFEGQAEEEAHAEEGWSAVAFRWFNVLVLFGGLGYLLRQPAAAFFKERSELIQGGLERAQAAQREADDRLKDVQARLSGISAEVDAIKGEADRSSTVEKGRIVADAQAEAHRAVVQSAAEVERITEGMERTIRAETADLVISKVEEHLRRRMTDRDRERSVRQAFDQL